MLKFLKSLFGIESPKPVATHERIESAPYKVPEPAATTPIPLVVEVAAPVAKAPVKPAAKPKAAAIKAPAKAKAPVAKAKAPAAKAKAAPAKAKAPAPKKPKISIAK